MVQLFGKENEQLNLQIGRSGDVSFPKLGSITLSGLTFEDARDLIKTRVEQQLIGVDAIVSMGRLRAINVFMAGEVSVPGAYSVSASDHGHSSTVSGGWCYGHRITPQHSGPTSRVQWLRPLIPMTF